MNALDLAARGLARRALQAQQTLTSNGGAELVGTSFGYSAQQRMGETVSILEAVGAGTHNAVLTGTNDDDHLAGIQTLVDQLSASGGGIIEVPANGALRLNFGSALVPKNNVGFRGARHRSNAPTYGAAAYSGNAFPTFKALPGCRWIMESGAGTLSQFSATGIRFEGIDGDGGGGIHIPHALRGGIVNCVFITFDEQAIWGEEIRIYLIEDNIVLGSLLNRTRAALSGAAQFDMLIDSMVNRGEYGCSIIDTGTGTNPGLTDANMYCAAMAIGAASSSCWFHGIVNEFSDVGLDIAGSHHFVSECRGEFAAAYGFRIRCTDSDFISNRGYRNGSDADNTYSDFRVESGAIRNVGSGNRGISATVDANRVAHVVEDAGSTTTSPNTWTGTYGIAHRGTTFSLPAGSNNLACIQVLPGGTNIFSHGDTSPSVDNRDKFQWQSPTAVSVSMFDDGVPGQVISVRSNVGAVVTIVHNASNIVNLNGANRILIANKDYKYENVGGVWYEQPHHYGVSGGGSTATGDADATLTVGSVTTRRWTIALTAGRTATLSATGASKGDRLHVVRNAGGAFNLAVVNGGPGAGTLATLAVTGTFAICEFDGINWFLAAT